MTEIQATMGGGLATHANYPNHPQYWSSNLRESQCLSWRQRRRPFISKSIRSYVDQIKERLASFTVARRNMAVREERCANSDLEKDPLGGKINAMKLVVTKFKG